MKYGKAYGGAYPELIEGDVFRTIIKVPDFTVYPEELTLRPVSKYGARLESGLESGLANKILQVIKNTSLGKLQIAQALGHQSTSSALHKQIRYLVSEGYIELTLPQKPQSRMQKYRLTSKGVHALQKLG